MKKSGARSMATLAAMLSMAASTTLVAQEQAGSDSPVPSAEPATTEPEQVLVTGEHPGPGLWKVSKGDNVLWILATYAPLPKDMVWRSAEVEAAIAQSQEVLYPGTVDVGVDVGFFKSITLIPALLKATKNPDGKMLEDLVPAEAYAKWSQLKARYMGKDDGVEKVRPSMAANQLRGTAIRKSGLVYERRIGAVVDKLAKKHKVRIHRLPAVKRKAHVEDPRRILKATHKVQLADADCFSLSLDRLEADVEILRTRANAWAIGDLATLRDPANAEPRYVCEAAVLHEIEHGALADEVGAREAIEDLKRQSRMASDEVRQTWIEAAEAALAKNQSTFALLSVDNLLKPDGYLAMLRARGYVVVEPR